MNIINNKNFIGLFDSGFGGISVLNECIKLMPGENYVYYADSQNRPYGKKNKNQLINIGKSIVEKFEKHSPSHIIIACGTMSTSSILELKSTYKNLSIIGTYPNFEHLLIPNSIVSEKKLSFNLENGINVIKSKKKILMLATNATCKSEYVQEKVLGYKDIFDIFVKPADKIVTYVENDEIDSKNLYQYLENLLCEYKDLNYIILGCTHFSFVKDIIEKIVGNNVIVTSGAETAAKMCQSKIVNKNKYNEKPFIKIIDIMIDEKRKNTYMKLLSENAKHYNVCFDTVL